jgi:L-2,4-diaminobutyrate transaminase
MQHNRNRSQSPHRIAAAHSARAGVLTRALPFAAVNSFSPPLSIDNREIDEAIEHYARTLDVATPELRALAPNRHSTVTL